MRYLRSGERQPDKAARAPARFTRMKAHVGEDRFDETRSVRKRRRVQPGSRMLEPGLPAQASATREKTSLSSVTARVKAACAASQLDQGLRS
ncbi:hypothetical protein [Lysobacter gummosus]|uniref:hypothetical protein n=1 Tax=Lysobacter gummosus TaxID=262324 RepID=UPI0036370502